MITNQVWEFLDSERGSEHNPIVSAKAGIAFPQNQKLSVVIETEPHGDPHDLKLLVVLKSNFPNSSPQIMLSCGGDRKVRLTHLISLLGSAWNKNSECIQTDLTKGWSG